MLLQFNFKNFKSFRDENGLDLVATGISEYSDHIISAGGENVLPLAAVFGANASGKSNALQAFDFMHYCVLNSNTFKNSDVSPLSVPFMLNTDSMKKPSSFEVFFVDTVDGKTYNYGFEILGNIVVDEWLFYKAKTSKTSKLIFRRNEKEIVEFAKKLEHVDMLKTAFDSVILTVSLGAQFNISVLKKVWNWFSKCICVNYGNPKTNMELSRHLPNGFAQDIGVQHDVIDYFSSFDDAIKEFMVEERKDNHGTRPMYIVGAVHKNDSVTASFPMGWESAGTLKMFSLYQPILSVLKNGGVLFLDELNARLHPLLVRMIVNTFLDKEINIHHAQLVFSSHEPWLLECELLRRDEIWFTEKDKDGSTTLYSLSDFYDAKGDKIRKDENFAKNYLLGKYGAIPSLKGLGVMKEAIHEKA